MKKVECSMYITDKTDYRKTISPAFCDMCPETECEGELDEAQIAFMVAVYQDYLYSGDDNV